MQDKPKFMSARWQSNLMRERPILFWLLVAAITFPVLFVLRLGLNGALGGIVQTVLRLLGAVLFLGLAWLLIRERMRRKERNASIDAYLDRRYEQTHEGGPPKA